MLVQIRTDHNELGYILEEEDLVNFVKKLEWGSGRFIGKLPFKLIACGRVGHYAKKCPHKDNNEKGKESTKGNILEFAPDAAKEMPQGIN